MSLAEALLISLALMLGLALHSVSQIWLFWWVLSGKASRKCGGAKTASKKWDRRIPRQHS